MSRYKKQLNSDRWKRFADDVKRRDNYKCVDCGSVSNLQVHHKVYYQSRSPWDYTIDLLETLCGTCHMKKHNGISVDSFVSKDRKSFKSVKRVERIKYREKYKKENIFKRGMTADEITKALKQYDMKEVHEVYTTVGYKYVVKFSSEDKESAVEFMQKHNAEHPEDQYRIMSLFTYYKIPNNGNTTNQTSSANSIDEVHGIS